MPQPTRGDVHVDRPLTNVSIAFMQQAGAFVAPTVFPSVPVSKQSDTYYIYDRGDFFRSEAQKRAPGTESAGSGWTLSTDTYTADVWAVHKDVDDQIRANADDPLDMDRDAAEYVTRQLLIRRDKEWAANYFATGVWDVDLDGVTGSPSTNQFLRWDESGSTPISDMRGEIITVMESTGFKPNVAVLGAHVWSVLQDHEEFLDRIKHTERGIVTEDLLAATLGLDRVIVAEGVENTAEEGATDSFSFLLGKHALLAYAAPSPSLMHPSAGYTFSWTGLLGAGAQGNRIKNFRMEALESDRIEGEMAFDMKVVASSLGAFFEDAVS